MGPRWFRRAILPYITEPNLQRLRDIASTMQQSSEGIFKSKREAFLRGDAALREQVGRGKDVMSILRAYAVILHQLIAN